MWLAKRLSLNLNFSFFNRISLLLISSSTQLSSRGWVDPVPDPILPEQFLGYSRESNRGPSAWQSDVQTTIPNRRSIIVYTRFLPKIRGTTAPKSQDRLKRLLPDGSTGVVVCKALSLNLNFSFLNRISLLVISSSYPIGLTRLGGPRSKPYTPRKISRV